VSQTLSNSSPQNKPASDPITIRPLRETDLPEADRIFRTAFGTFIGLPDPLAFYAGRELIRPRWLTNPTAALAAESNGQLIGSNFAARWGSVAFFGPLTVRPDYWDRGVAKRLLEHTMPIFDAWNIRHAGLFTFPDSPKHLGLYRKFGFHPRFLTAVMIKEIAPNSSPQKITRYSTLTETQQAETLRAARELTDLLFEDLDLTDEIRAVHQHKFGDTILVWNNSQLAAFAICHFGAGTEGGPACCYIKFAAARPGPNAGETFDRLLRDCQTLAAAERLPVIEAGVNLACANAYEKMLAHGYQTKIQGIAMHKPNEPAYHHADAFVIEDWR
jgi:GNAT superfamily N-acetyltransferase